jgi:ABC-type multidrug transport system permease subunit
MNSLKDELRFLFSGRGMPYEKVSMMVAIVCAVVFTLVLGNNAIHDAPVAVIDLDNSKYSHEVTQMMDASPFIRVDTVINTAVDPNTLFYADKYVAVVYLPQNLEKNRYAQGSAAIGVFYDNSNTAQTADLKTALNEIVATENLAMAGASTDSPGMTLRERNLFNPSGSSSNGETQGFLFFFSSMFFVFATIGMIPRLRMEGKLQQSLEQGTPFDILLRLLPYCGCLLTALFVGMAILRLANDMVFTGSTILFLITQFFYIPAVGILSLLFGWSAANPGVASSRMILFIPGGFILGGATGPIPILSQWVQIGSHIFPLVWEYEFIRDIMMRGAGFWDIASEFGQFLFYFAALIIIFCFRFHITRKHMINEHATLRNQAMEG